MSGRVKPTGEAGGDGLNLNGEGVLHLLTVPMMALLSPGLAAAADIAMPASGDNSSRGGETESSVPHEEGGEGGVRRNDGNEQSVEFSDFFEKLAFLFFLFTTQEISLSIICSQFVGALAAAFLFTRHLGH